MYLQPQPAKKKTEFNSFSIWWANLLPPQIKAIMPHWSISASIITGFALFNGNQLAVTMVSLFWASIIFTLIFRTFRTQLAKHRWVIYAYHAMLYATVARPVMAQEAGEICTNAGLFSDVTNFINQIFSTVTFGGLGGGSLSAMICQVVGLLTVGLLLGFLGVLGTVSYQVGYQRQPLTTTLDPVFAFLIFAGGATFVISVMLGTGGSTTGVGGVATP